MREKISNVMRHNSIDKTTSIPDIGIFKQPALLPGDNCRDNDKPFNLDIQDESSLEVTLCVFLAFELEGEFSTEGLLDEIEEYITLEFETGYVLKGAFSAGIKITIDSLTSPAQIELDPITTQLYMQADVSGLAGLGLFSASLTGNAELDGELSLGYCPSCNGTYPLNEYQQVSVGSSFYFSRLVGYDMDLALRLFAGVPAGVEFGGTAMIGIQDDDVFDHVSPNITLPDMQFIRDAMKFSPQNAVSKYLAEVYLSFLFFINVHLIITAILLFYQICCK